MRLIDADELLRKLTYSADGRRFPDYDCDNFPVQISVIDVKKMIREAPTEATICGPALGCEPANDRQGKRLQEARDET